MKVSVIIPVYNATGCLPIALDSLKEQTFRDFEVVFVDDCSTDGTPAVIEAFNNESGLPCKIVRQDVNGGVAAARNKGLEAADGEYLAFLDADDRMEPKTLTKAVEAAERGDADIVGWDWILGFEKNGRYMRQADYDSPLLALKNLMGGTMRWNLWLFLLKRNLLIDNNIRFIEGANMGEDMMVMIKAYLKAGKVTQIHEPLYRYNAISQTSLSRQFSEERRREISTNLAEAERTVLESRYSGQLGEYVNHLKLFLKLPLLISGEKSNYQTWYSWFPEANVSAMANKDLPLRTRLLQGMAERKLWGCVKMYYLCVYKFVYGIIYR